MVLETLEVNGHESLNKATYEAVDQRNQQTSQREMFGLHVLHLQLHLQLQLLDVMFLLKTESHSLAKTTSLYTLPNIHFNIFQLNKGSSSSSSSLEQ